MSKDNELRVAPETTGLAAEDYQTYEMALKNDGVLRGDNIAQIRSYAAYARAQAQAIHKTITATRGIDEVAAIKAEATETAQTFARVGIYADQRIGELLRELPKGKGNQYQQSAEVGMPTKAQAERDAGISHAVSIDLQAMAANPDVVQAVLDKAEAEGRVVSRKQVLDAINERKRAERERDEAEHDAAEMRSRLSDLRDEVAALERQNEELAQQQVMEREVVREVVPDDYAQTQQRVRELTRLERIHDEDNRKLRKQLAETRSELERAKGVLGMDKTVGEVRRDVKYLTSATNQYVRRYGGLTWTAQSLADVDPETREELTRAVRNLATFSNALMTTLEAFNG